MSKVFENFNIKRLINIDPTRDKSIEFALKMFDFVELKHLEIDQSV